VIHVSDPEGSPGQGYPVLVRLPAFVTRLGVLSARTDTTDNPGGGGSDGCGDAAGDGASVERWYSVERSPRGEGSRG
jgi:hypothetical protein